MFLRLLLILLIMTACRQDIYQQKLNPYATPAVIEFRLGNLNFDRSVELFPSGDSISKSSLLVTPDLYDSIMQGMEISEPIDRHHHYVTVLFIDKDLFSDTVIRYDNIAGFGVYSVENSIMNYKLFVKKDGTFNSVDQFTCTARHVYCDDNNAIARLFMDLTKKRITWLLLCDRAKAPRVTSKHELTERIGGNSLVTHP